VLLHEAVVDDICATAQTLAGNCNAEMITLEASQLAARFHALMSAIQVHQLQ